MDFSSSVFSQNASRRGFRLVTGVNLETPGLRIPLPHRGSKVVVAGSLIDPLILVARTIAAHGSVDSAGRQRYVPEQIGRAVVNGCAYAPDGQIKTIVEALKGHACWEVPGEPTMRMFKVSVRAGFDAFDKLRQAVEFAKWPTSFPLDLSGYNETSHYGPDYPTSSQARKMQEQFFAQAPEWVRGIAQV